MFIQANQLSKIYSTDWVFRHISFDLQEGDRVGLVGPNGCGKTTLLKCITKQESWEEGELFIRKALSIGYLQQIPSIAEDVTVQRVLYQAFSELEKLEQRMKELELKMSTPSENQDLDHLLEEYGKCQKEFEAKGGYEIEAKIDKVCQGLGISKSMREAAFMRLSGGEKTKVSLAVILLQEPELLLLDEPTNHLDLDAIEWLEEFLQAYQGAVLVVSHDRYFLDQVVNKIFDLENGELSIYLGNYSAFIKQKEERLLAEFQSYQEQQKKIRKMQETIKRLRQWANEANPPNAGLHRRASSMQKALDRMEKLKRPVLERRKIGLSFELEQRSGKDVLTVEGVGIAFGERKLFAELNMHVRFQEKAALIGKNGTGKSTLFKMLLGQLSPDEGLLKLGSRVKLGYLSQSGIEGYDNETVLDAYRDLAKMDEGEARHALARFLFYGASVFPKVKDLSGGEKMRLRFAQLMAQDINLLLLDEPTNHLDIDSREVLEDALEEFTGTVLAISHDRYFLNKLFSKTYWLEDHSLTLYLGGYDEAKEQRQKQLALRDMSHNKIQTAKHQQDSAGKPKQGHQKMQKPQSQQKQEFNQKPSATSYEKSRTVSREKLEKLEAKIEELEKSISEINSMLFLPENQDKLEELQSWAEQKLELEQYRDVLLEEWLMLQ